MEKASLNIRESCPNKKTAVLSADIARDALGQRAEETRPERKTEGRSSTTAKVAKWSRTVPILWPREGCGYRIPTKRRFLYPGTSIWMILFPTLPGSGGAGYENPCLSGFLYPAAWNTLTLGTESEKNVFDGNRAEMYGEVPEGGRVSE